MSITRKVAAFSAVAALMAPVGIAQAHHGESGKATAPGQVCKVSKEQKRAMKGAEGKAAKKAAREARKQCIKKAVAERKAHNRASGETPEQSATQQ